MLENSNHSAELRVSVHAIKRESKGCQSASMSDLQGLGNSHKSLNPKCDLRVLEKENVICTLYYSENYLKMVSHKKSIIFVLSFNQKNAAKWRMHHV